MPRVLCAALAALSILMACIAVADDARSIADGVYTEGQAASGELLYAEHCLICHDKKYFRPVLKRWNGQPISMMYLIMSSSMPESNPASLQQEEYADILAYILSLSRYPAGDTPLTVTDEALERILVAPRRR
ncbi:MAG: cytochrome c [Woeseia sp.]|nr:cytochrome c [Woeseia sp.]MBT8096031.1 cytochrome c [Woeseia sp.]NNE59534.1 cytochrome c [Woeseia sp.]NNL54379.1 cytochrome c [Woeseia sp.]